MNRQTPDFLSFRRWAGILGGFLLVVFGGVYFFNVSAQTEIAGKQPAAQNLVNGKIVFTRRLAGPTAPEGRIVTSNPDGSGRVTISVPSTEDVTQPA